MSEDDILERLLDAEEDGRVTIKPGVYRIDFDGTV